MADDALTEFSPPMVPRARAPEALWERGFAVLAAPDVRELSAADAPQLEALARDWGDLPVDPHLKGGGSYRRRRHGSFLVRPDGVVRVPHRPHFQAATYNALHGGMLRWFAPLGALGDAAPWPRLLSGVARILDAVRPAEPWFVEAHQVRIDTRDGIGRPTPEGAHRDGVDFVALILVAREGVRGGETRVFDAHAPTGVRFTLREPWTLMLLDDQRVVHESTPIMPEFEGDSRSAHRDTLVLTYRRHGFQDP